MKSWFNGMVTSPGARRHAVPSAGCARLPERLAGRYPLPAGDAR